MHDDQADRRASRLPSRQRTALRRGAILTTALLAAAGVSAPIAFAATTPNDAPQAIGSAPQVPAGAVRAPDPAPDSALNLSVELTPRDPAALTAFVAAVSNPKSPQYRHYLAKGQFASTFGPTADAIKSVTDELGTVGLRPGPVSADGMSIPVHTTISAAERAFGTKVAHYRLADGRTASVNLAAPHLRGSVAQRVTGVVGLSDLAKLTPRHTQPHDAATLSVGSGTQPHAVAPHSPTPSTCSGLQTVLNNNSLVDTRDYWEPATLSANYAYGTGQLYSQYGNTGSGVTVGIFELESYSANDVASYQRCFGTNVALNNVLVDGGPTTPPSPNAGVGTESALDIETVAGLAPGSAITVYQGRDASGATNANVLDVYRRMVNDDTAQVLSTSWGVCEADIAPSGMMAAESNIFAQAAAQGQTVFAASGDSGSTDCYPNSGSPHRFALSVDDPAAQPYVTAVGGTRMSGSSPTVQTPWNTPNTAAAGAASNGAAGGGGVSNVEVLSDPNNFQAGVTGPGYANGCGATGTSTCRQVPDVAALADPATGYLIANGQNNGQQSWRIVGGTSGAAPLWAAIAALADSSASCAANGPIGFANPALYKNPSALTDITTGNNVVSGTGYSGNLYQAATGYDMASGLGAPKAPQLVEALCGATTAAPGGSFQAATPTRVLDTRDGTGTGKVAPIVDHSSISVQMTGANGVPTSGVTAVVLNVTATNPTAGSFLTVWPDGVARPMSSNVNFSPGQTIPNLVTVPVGQNGKVDIYNLNGTVDVIADLFGYYTTTTGSLLQPVTPVRMLDTRDGTGTGRVAPIVDHSSIGVQMTGANGVPTSGVTAVVLNVTATNPTAGSFLTVWPDGMTRPGSSNLNFSPGQTIPNLVTVPVGQNGKVDIYNLNGTVDVLADLFGYYTNSGSGLKFHPSTPHRLLDTRTGQGVAPNQPAPVSDHGTLALPLTDSNGIPGNAGPLAGAGGLMLNVTAAEPTQSSFVTVYPSGLQQRPTASNLNFTPGEVIPNAVLTPVNGSAINFYNLNGTVQLIVDVFGYFAQS